MKIISQIYLSIFLIYTFFQDFVRCGNKSISMKVEDIIEIDLNQGEKLTLIAENPIESEDLFLTTLPKPNGIGFGKVKFQIKDSSKNKQEQENDHQACEIEKMYDYCTLNTDEIKQFKYYGAKSKKMMLTYYFTCEKGPCDFNLKYSQGTQGTLVENEKLEILFKEEVQFLDVKIPLSYDRIIIPIKFEGRKDDIHAQTATLEDDLDESLQYVERHLIDDTVVFVFIHDTDSEICTGCHYTIQMISDIGSMATAQIFYYTDKKSIIKLNYPRLDYLFSEIPETYEVDLEDNQDYDSYNFLRFTFNYLGDEVYSPVVITGGELNGKMQAEAQENSLLIAGTKEAKQDTLFKKEFSMVIRRDELGGSFRNKKLIFIVYGFVEEFATINVELIKGRNIQVQQKQVISASVQQNSFDYYQLKVANYKKQNNPSQSVKIVLKQAVGESDLLVVKTAGINDQYKQADQSDFPVESKNGIRSSQFNIDCDDTKDFCYYQILVKGSVSQQHDSVYMLEFTYGNLIENKFQLVELYENVVFTDTILGGTYNDYFFEMNEVKDLRELLIKVSSQELQTYAGAKSRCDQARPGCEKVQRGTMFKPIKFRNFKDAYMQGIVISVKSDITTEFTITAETQREKYEHVVKLENSYSFPSEIDSKEHHKFFEFEADLQKDEDLIINIRAPSNKLMIVVSNDGTYPDLGIDNYGVVGDSEGAQWNSRSNYLKIKHTFKDYISKGNYMIGIFSLPGIQDGPQAASIPFKIMVSTSKTLKVLEFNEAFHDYLDSVGTQYYEVVLDKPDVRSIYLSQSILNNEDLHSDLTFYIGSQFFQNVTDYEYVLKETDKGTFELDQFHISRLCQKIDETCSFYVAVQNTGRNQIQYSLTVWEQESGIELKEGLQYEYTLYHVDGYMNFFYQPINYENSLNLYLYSHFGETNFTMSIYNNKDNIPTSQWPFPKSDYGIIEKDHINKEIDYTSGIHHSHSISISKEKMQSLKKNDILLISVGFMELDNQEISKKDTFTLLVHSDMMQIHQGQKIEFSLEEDESKYSFFPLRNVIRNKENVYIDLTPLSGKGTMAMTLSNDDYHRVPSENNFDWFTAENYVEVSYKDIQSIMKEYGMKSYDNVELSIEILSTGGTGKFTIDISTDSFKKRNVLHGLPQEFHLGPNKRTSFKFYNYFGEDIQFRLSKDYGHGFMSIISCIKWEDCRDGEYDSTFTAGANGALQEIKKGDSLWCQDCYFLVSIKNSDISEMHAFLYTIVDTEPVWLSEGRELFDNNDKKEYNIYRISAPSTEEVKLSMMFYWGSPQVYISYYYSTNYKDYCQGPYTKNNQNTLHLNIPARDDIMDQVSQQKKRNKNNAFISQEDNLYKDLVENEIYVMVMNKESSKLASNYTITYTTGENERFIADGHVTPFLLPQRETASFVYQHYDIEQQITMTINIQDDPQHNIKWENLIIEAFLQEQESRLEENDVAHQVELQKVSQSQGASVYALPKATGGYLFEIVNKSNFEAKFTVYFNTRDVTILPLGHTIQHFIEKDSINYYEVIVPYSGVVVLTTEHCMGSFDIGFSQNLDNFIQQRYDLTTEETSQAGAAYIDAIDVKKGALYTAILTPPTEQAMYSLKANFYRNSTMVPHFKVRAGNEGQIDVEKPYTGTQVYLEFNPVFCTECSQRDLSRAKILYKVIWAKDIEHLNVIGKCRTEAFFDHTRDKLQQTHEYFEQQIQPQDSNSGVYSRSYTLELNDNKRLNFTFPIDDIKVTYYASVIAEVYNFTDSNEQFLLTYNNVEILPLVPYYKTGKLEEDLMIVGGITLVAFGLFVFCLLVRRFFFRPSLKRNKFGLANQQQSHNSNFSQINEESFDNFNTENSHVSILDTSTPIQLSQNEDEDNKQFTFSKNLAEEEGLQQFDQFQDEI